MNSLLQDDPQTDTGLPPATVREVTAARFYEDQLVPAMFGQYAPRLVAAAGIRAGHRVLDVACGTGVASREAGTVTGPDSPPTGVDISPGMLAVAAESCAAIDWRLGDAMDLPFADAVFDRVVCQFGLMFFADPVGALREMLRVLKPDGRLAVAVWNSISEAPGSTEMSAILERMAGSRAAEALSLPYRLGDTAELERLVSAAGIGNFEIETHAGEVRFPTVDLLIDAEIRGWLPIMGVQLDEALIEAVADECVRRFQPWIDPVNGALRTPTSAHILAGDRPR